ncbi:MAG: glycosyltransferase [Alphaproteobacteria bacterium]|nr:glycosyltransferase [Alphaproteobacteria bacterium]
MSFPPPPNRRVLYIRHKRLVKISDLFRLNQDEWVEALSALADVTVMTEDFDLDEVCDRIQPDFILYESPPIHAAPLNITNPAAHPAIPRIGFLMQDPHCSSRVHFLRLIDELNIQWLFTHMTEAALRQSPELQARIFSVSLFFDDKVFYDYGLPKTFPVSVFGGFLAPEIYAWRAKAARVLPEHFPTFIYTHPGYLQPTPRHAFAVTGEAYARMLNQSAFSLADTTRLDCLVRKHLEIPASGAVLIAPDTPVLKPYGFRDMENCLLGEGDALFDKIAAVADDPEMYEKIRKNGYDLVHSRYSRKHWRGILDFYECLRNLKAGETVQQQGVLGPFKAMEKIPSPPSWGEMGRACPVLDTGVRGAVESPTMTPPSPHPPKEEGSDLPAIAATYPDSVISAQLRSWLGRILGNESLDEISDEILKIPDWLFHMMEEWVLLGIIAALKGDMPHATEFFLAGQSLRKKLTGYTDYDPEEIAWLSLIAAMTGNAALLDMTRREAAGMQHLSLRRIAWLGNILASGGDASNPPPEALHRQPNDRLSIHWTGQLKMREWLGLIERILAANGAANMIRI